MYHWEWLFETLSLCKAKNITHLQQMVESTIYGGKKYHPDTVPIMTGWSTENIIQSWQWTIQLDQNR